MEMTITKVESAPQVEATIANLKGAKMRYNPESQHEAVRAAAKCAKRHGVDYMVYRGNSFMRTAYHCTYNKAEAYDAINNCGGFVCIITPDGTARIETIEWA